MKRKIIVQDSEPIQLYLPVVIGRKRKCPEKPSLDQVRRLCEEAASDSSKISSAMKGISEMKGRNRHLAFMAVVSALAQSKRAKY